MRYEIRDYRLEDLDAVTKICRQSIRQMGGEYYSAEQVEAWASFPGDAEEFAAWIGDASTFVAVDQCGELVGFAGLQPQGRISSLFVSPDCKRMGIASKLLEHLMDVARSRSFEVITTEASEFSKPLFEKFGFSVIEVEHSQFKGVDFTRYAMQSA